MKKGMNKGMGRVRDWGRWWGQEPGGPLEIREHEAGPGPSEVDITRWFGRRGAEAPSN